MLKILYSFSKQTLSREALSRSLVFGLIILLGISNLSSAKAAIDPQWIKVKAKYSKLTPDANKILMQKCKDCHTNHVEYPFYAQLPIIQDLIKADVRKGRAYFNMDNEIFLKDYDTDISSATLNRLQTVL